MNVGQIAKAMEGGTEREPSAEMKKRLMDMYGKFMPQLLQSLEARRTDRMDGVQKLLDERAGMEAKNIEEILKELEQAIKNELDEPKAIQLELFSTDEKDQLHRNMDALRRRLQEIPNEIKAEQEQIRKRFADPQPRMFPVAVTFLVRENMAK